MDIFDNLLERMKSRKNKVIIGAISGIVLASAASGFAYYEANATTLYHVYIDDKDIGVVQDSAIVDDWKEKELNKLEEKYGLDELTYKNKITYGKEKKYKGTFNNNATLQALAKELELQTDGVEVIVDGKVVGYVKDKDTVNSMLAELKQAYTAKEDKSKVVASSINEKDTTVVEHISIKEKIEPQEAKVSPDQILSKEDMLKLLKNGTTEEKTYTVQSGDTISEIADKFDLKTAQVYQLNPKLEGEYINIGDELSVTQQTPLVTVETKETITRTNNIPFQVDIKKDSSMYSNQSKVVEQGVEGEKEVTYSIVKENGNIIEKKIVNEIVIKEPVNKLVKKGTKSVPVKSSGRLNWPTVGGVVTSNYGERWGRQHKGIDISGVSNRTIKAADNGRVKSTGWISGYGKAVVISHGNGIETLYAHLNTISVSDGQKVSKGQKIGVMGTTGRTVGGANLHFEVIKNGVVRNPLSYIRK